MASNTNRDWYPIDSATYKDLFQAQYFNSIATEHSFDQIQGVIQVHPWVKFANFCILVDVIFLIHSLTQDEHRQHIQVVGTI
ncbi:hypothetical protein GQ43DRAFT_369809 [Delitschia confertaspora ATCC 74209]|uniref:Uncharacterized protein n=1 Tax=Delitschia confertaspora ATCC 74209 TaxID=1513339 RepID=A0A9P4JT67_9PLEO|nr:hypothetical protein GQ43DRAFT_369809 [Delitschia confertaspora ATCC 74209]